MESFREKPDLETAKSYLEAGNYLWNAGIFVWNVDTITESIRNFTPALAEKMDRMAESFYTADEQSVVGEIFPTCEKISIDYAVMEHADYIYTFPADFGCRGECASERLQGLHRACSGGGKCGS